MTSRRKQRKMDEKKIDYTAQSPKNSSGESVDDLLSNVDQFIQGVYRELSLSPTPLRDTTLYRSRRSFYHDTSTSSVESSPVRAATGADRSSESHEIADVVLTPTTRRNMDAEIERINRMCDNVDQNLRSIGLFMNSSAESSTSQETSDPFNTAIKISVNSPSSSTSNSSVSRQGRNRERRRSSPVISPVIDLSVSQTLTPQVQRDTNINYNNRNDNDDDDDVIIVSEDIPAVVDLCTPGGYQEPVRERPSINYRQLNRRRLTHQDDDSDDTGYEGPSSNRRRRTEYFTPPEHKFRQTASTAESTKPNNALNTSNTTTSERTPFMCPVCMESCLQRQPTSTRCGHVFCQECIQHAIRLTHKCPMCNTRISRNQTFRIYL